MGPVTLCYNIKADYCCKVCGRNIIIGFPYNGMNLTALLQLLPDRFCTCGNRYTVRHASYDLRLV